ncbi:MAG: TrkA family potassium uptake protein [Anaerolineales bacterium]|nr:TrkA family potassium uptake protein [Anaerolineales bacterium]
MFVMIVGGGRVGSQLTTLLIELGHKVRLIENRAQVIERLHREIPTEVLHVGDPLDLRVLEQAGVRQADVLVTAMADDAINLAVSYLAKAEFEVVRIIGRVNNPRYAWLFRPDMGVDVALNAADVLAHLIQEELTLGDMMPLLTLKQGKYSLITEKVPPNAPAIGVTIQDLDLPEHCVIAAIIRSGEVIVPRGVTTIRAGDEVLAVVDREAAKILATLFEPESSPLNSATGSKPKGVL